MSAPSVIKVLNLSFGTNPKRSPIIEVVLEDLQEMHETGRTWFLTIGDVHQMLVTLESELCESSGSGAPLEGWRAQIGVLSATMRLLERDIDATFGLRMETTPRFASINETVLEKAKGAK